MTKVKDCWSLKFLCFLPHYNIDDNDDAGHFGDHFKLGVNVSDYM